MHINLVDHIKSFQTSMHLYKSASMQPRTSRSKFADTYGVPTRPRHKYRSVSSVIQSGYQHLAFLKAIIEFLPADSNAELRPSAHI